MKSYFYINEIRGGRRMTKEELIRNLKYTEENKVNTFDTNISMMY